jgi:predicted aldo/keto reductase-like oxidoreductase
MDVENQASTGGLVYAAHKGLAVAIMEGLHGSMLTGQVGISARNLGQHCGFRIAGPKPQSCTGT